MSEFKPTLGSIMSNTILGQRAALARFDETLERAKAAAEDIGPLMPSFITIVASKVVPPNEVWFINADGKVERFAFEEPEDE